MRSGFGRIAAFLIGFSAVLASSCHVFAEDGIPGNWKESTGGRWESLPDRHVGATDNGISFEVTMAPGTGVSYRREDRQAPTSAALRFAVDNVNVGRNDYLPGEAVFPAAVTFVFGDDSLKLGVKNRIGLFFRHLWHGFGPSGIRLTYAWGNGVPVKSMYRLWEEETVFVVAGPEDAGKTISTTRRLADDFRAAYGRLPNGPVTEVRVSARRPSREKGTVRASITVRIPGE